MPKKWAALSKCTFPASLFQLLLYWLHKQTYSKVTTHTTHYMIKTIYWAKVFKCTKSNKGQLLVDLWSDTWLKSNQNWQDQKSLSLPWIIFCSFLSVHSLTFHFLLLHSWITSFFWPFIMEFVVLFLLRVATFSLRKRRNGTHGLKGAKENQPQKPCSSLR